MLLNVADLDIRYGRNHAVKGLNLSLEEGEIVTVLGANGAGKSSLLKAIQGTVKPAAGEVNFDNQLISQWSASKRVREGLAMVPEGRQIFVSLTVEENLLMGGYTRGKENLAPEINALYENFPNLAERRNMPASVLSGGEQQMLAIARAMLSRPKLLMLDEPSLGLSPILVEQLFQLIKSLNDDGLTILLVEQNTHMALQCAHRGYVLELGSCVTSGATSELMKQEKLAEAYLGSG